MKCDMKCEVGKRITYQIDGAKVSRAKYEKAVTVMGSCRKRESSAVQPVNRGERDVSRVRRERSHRG